MLNWQATNGHLTLELGYSNYKQLLFSNHPHETAGETTEVAFSARALGISAILVTADNQFIIMRRSDAVGEGPSRLDVLGAIVTPAARDLAKAHEVFDEESGNWISSRCMTLGRETVLMC